MGIKKIKLYFPDRLCIPLKTTCQQIQAALTTGNIPTGSLITTNYVLLLNTAVFKRKQLDEEKPVSQAEMGGKKPEFSCPKDNSTCA